MNDYHTIILGLGGLGSAALYWAARRPVSYTHLTLPTNREV